MHPGQDDPRVGVNQIPRHATTVRIGQPEMKLGLGIPFIGSKPKPSRSLGVVLWDAVAIRVGEPEIVLSDGQTLIRCLAQPPGRLGIIPLYAPTSRWW